MLLLITQGKVTCSEQASTERYWALTENLSLEIHPEQSLSFSILVASSMPSCPPHQCSLDTDVSQTRDTKGEKENPFFWRVNLTGSQENSQCKQGGEWGGGRLGTGAGHSRGGVFSCSKWLDRLFAVMSNHTWSYTSTEPGAGSTWGGWHGLLPLLHFIVTLLEQWPSHPRLAFPADLQEVFSYQVSPISCRGGPEELRPLCAGQTAPGFLSNTARDVRWELQKYGAHTEHDACAVVWLKRLTWKDILGQNWSLWTLDFCSIDSCTDMAGKAPFGVNWRRASPLRVQFIPSWCRYTQIKTINTSLRF